MLMKQSQLTWRQGDTAESHTEGAAISIASLCTYQHQTAETTQRGWRFKDLTCKVTQKDSSQGDL